jgi:hypothetical protein
VGPIHYYEGVHSSNTLDQPVSQPTILEACTEPAGMDPFRRLKGGFIQFEGLLKVAQVRGRKERIYNVDLRVWDS